MEQIFARSITINATPYFLSVKKEDLSSLYPNFFRYTLTLSSRNIDLAVFRTNSYEYSPGVPLMAEEVALQKAEQWEQELAQDAGVFLALRKIPAGGRFELPHADVVIIQGSPRADGNCSTFAAWAADAVSENGMSTGVIFPHDMEIHECIGCYQCYNTGTCIYDDDMAGIIRAIRMSQLVIICSPVYTNTVPGGLKLLIDRCQAYHAERTVAQETGGPKNGLILAVAGRPGGDNFTCIRKVLNAYLHNAGISTIGGVFVDDADRVKDIRNVPGLQEKVKNSVRQILKK